MSWSTSGGGGASELIESLIADNDAVMDFDPLVPGFYYMQFRGLTPVVSNDNLLLRFGTGATPTYETTLYGYNIHAMHSSGHILTFNSDGGESSIRVLNSVDEASVFGAMGTLELFLPASRRPMTRGSFSHIEHGSQVYQSSSMGWRNSNTVTGLRLLFAAGDILNGTVNLYKMAA